jgi:Transcriptional regulator PadR-like family
MPRRPSGYELKKLFTTTVGYGWRAYDTQLYRELKALERAGLMRGEDEAGRAGPQRRIYTVTVLGLEGARSETHRRVMNQAARPTHLHGGDRSRHDVCTAPPGQVREQRPSRATVFLDPLRCTYRCTYHPRMGTDAGGRKRTGAR